jgi:hypothetical protein
MGIIIPVFRVSGNIPLNQLISDGTMPTFLTMPMTIPILLKTPDAATIPNADSDAFK